MISNKSTKLIITFIGESFATKGFLFYFEGINSKCPKKCPLLATCQKNLESNTVYKVVDILGKKIKCPEELHEESMILVKVKKPIIKVSIKNKNLFVGSTMKFSPVKCDRTSCKYFNYCEPDKLLIEPDLKIKIIKKIKKIDDCPRELNLSIVKVEKKAVKKT